MLNGVRSGTCELVFRCLEMRERRSCGGASLKEWKSRRGGARENARESCGAARMTEWIAV